MVDNWHTDDSDVYNKYNNSLYNTAYKFELDHINDNGISIYKPIYNTKEIPKLNINAMFATKILRKLRK